MKNKIASWGLSFLALGMVFSPAEARVTAGDRQGVSILLKKQKLQSHNSIAKARVLKIQKAPDPERKISSIKNRDGNSKNNIAVSGASRLSSGIPKIHSQAAFVVDQETHEVLFKKNENLVMPMASITKLMTGLVLTQFQLPMEKEIAISTEDIDTVRGSSSRLIIGSSLSRDEMLHLALMSSENRAAHALGRTFPGGMSTFVSLMNHKAKDLGMKDTVYVEPTGLSSQNVSSAKDLALLVKAAHRQPVLRRYSTSVGHDVTIGDSTLQFNTTNSLVRDPKWHIGIQKTGYIVEAGRCMVLQAQIAGRNLIMVFLDSSTTQGRIADAQGIKRWIERLAS